MRSIVLTGAAGRLGGQLRASLAVLCDELRLVDQQPVVAERANEVVHQFDLNDRAALDRVMAGAQAVVHFSGFPREANWETLLAANVSAVAGLWESARSAGVQRVVYASSNHAVGLYPRSELLTEQVLPQPDSRYGVTKVFMESVAGLYAAKHGMRGFGIRIGHCASVPTDARMLSHWIHPEDLAQLVEVGLTADYHNEIVYGASANSRSWWRNERALSLGYQPRHSADAHIERLAKVTTTDAVSEYFQGGSFAAAEHDNPRHRPG